MQHSVIARAIETGFFTTKKPEKREEISSKLSLEFGESVQDILDKECHRRSEAYKRRAMRQAKKACEVKPLESAQESATSHILDFGKGRYVVTTAQNNTPVDKLFWDALCVYAAHMNARILVSKTTYNKNGFDNPEGLDVYYNNEVQPFLVSGHISLGGIDFLADANVLPTAKNPVSGFANATVANVSAIIPATKIALHCVARLKNQAGKILYSTGTCTQRNYILRKAGQVALGEHNIGALFVDTLGNAPTVRQLERVGDSEGFYDAGCYFSGMGVFENQYPTALQFGDIHAEKLSEKTLKKMRDLLCAVKPENIILHDLLDFSSRNHHNIKDCAFIFKQHQDQNTVDNDLKLVVDVLEELSESANTFGGKLHIVESNHDLALVTWLKNADFKLDPVNATTYLRCMLAMYEGIERGENVNMLKWACTHIGSTSPNAFKELPIAFHEVDDSLILAGVEMGVHGHLGANGARGGPQQFRALGVPINTGHTHSPSIHGACYTAGTMSLEMGYNVGPSSWQLANIVTWPNGQRQVVFM